MPPSKPNFIKLNGEVVPVGPLQVKGARRYVFLLQGQNQALQKVCDQWINQVSKGTTRLQPFGDIVLLEFTNSSCTRGSCSRETWLNKGCGDSGCAKAGVRYRSDSKEGFIKFNQLEFSFLAINQKGEVIKLSPYTFVDDNSLMAMQRELLGLNTTLGTLKTPGILGPPPIKGSEEEKRQNLFKELSTPKDFTPYVFNKETDYLSFEMIVPEEKGSEDLLFQRVFRQIPRTKWVCKVVWDHPSQEENTVADLPLFVMDVEEQDKHVKNVTARMKRSTDWNGRRNTMDGVASILEMALGGLMNSQYLQSYAWAICLGIKQLGLNQFRANADATRAFYQAIQEFSFSNVTIGDSGHIESELALEFNPELTTFFDNQYPFHENFGFAKTDGTTKLPIIAAFWMDCSYEVTPVEIVEDILKEN